MAGLGSFGRLPMTMLNPGGGVTGGPAGGPIPFLPGGPQSDVTGGPAGGPVPLGEPGGDAGGGGIVVEPPIADPGGSGVVGDQGAGSLPGDLIGDIPPPPIPAPPPIEGVGVAGIPGTEGSTFSRPGSTGAVPFRTAAFSSPRPPRFGPGTPFAGTGGEGMGVSLDPEKTAEILRQLAANYGGGGGPQ